MDSSSTQKILVSPAAAAATFFLIFLMLATPANSMNNIPTAYQILQSYNFPIGLLPNGVKGYHLNQTTGEFAAYFTHSCSFTGSFYQLKYEPTIKGYISNNMLSCLEGVSVKFLFFWMDIKEIIRRGDGLEFSVWFLSTRFPVDYFEESPQCGCGLYCSTGQVRKLRASPFDY